MSKTSINMRVTANSSQGHRKYMEDCYKIRFHRENQCDNESEILFSYFGIFDGHGGKEAAQFAKEHLYWKIIESDDFWSEDDNKVLKAIHDGFIKCHIEMWKDLPNWQKTSTGYPSTSGCTATVLFIKKSKAFVGHVGDSGVSIGFGDSYHTVWTGKKLTRDHKPDDPIEIKRIENSGGEVMSKGGVHRVVWNRPALSHQGPVTRNTNVEKIPFLAVARSLGDLWSYNYDKDEFIVSPIPDVFSFEIDPKVHRCIVMGSDGLWNIIRPNDIADIVRQTDKETESLVLRTQNKNEAQPFVNPSQRLVNTAIQRCSERMLRADNTTCITIMLDQPGISFSDNIIQKQTNQTLSDSQEVDVLYTPSQSEFNTPIFRSKSLMSVRRRHWSASTTASSAANSEIKRRTKSAKTLHHVNENVGYNTSTIKKSLFNQSYAFTAKTNSGVPHTIKSQRKHDKNKNDNHMLSITTTTTTTTNTTTMTNCQKTPLTTRYKRRLRLFKNRLLKTMNKNRKLFKTTTAATTTITAENNENEIDDDRKSRCDIEANNRSLFNSTANQSFASNLRTKLNTLKRQHLSNVKPIGEDRQVKKIKYN